MSKLMFGNVPNREELLKQGLWCGFGDNKSDNTSEYINIIPKKYKTFKDVANIYIEEIIMKSSEVDSKNSNYNGFSKSAMLNSNYSIDKNESLKIDDMKKMFDSITCTFHVGEIKITNTIEMIGVFNEILIHHMVEYIEYMSKQF